MKYLCKIFEEKYLVVGDTDDIPEGYVQISSVDYQSASRHAIKYFYDKIGKKTVKVRTYEAITAHEEDTNFKAASQAQIDAYDAANPEEL
jgi:hypothetical protein